MAGKPTFSFLTPTALIFGRGCAARAGSVAREAGASRVLVVTDEGIRKAQLLARVASGLSSEGLAFAVFDEVEEDAPLDVVKKGLKAYQDSGADCIVAVGGGSTLDTAKCIGTLAANDGPVASYEGVGKVPRAIPPLIGIPTTAGTASEVTINMVIYDRSRGYKIPIVSRSIACLAGLVDPLLTLSMPPAVTAATGFDAMTHAIESYVARTAWTATEVLAFEAIRLAGRHLVRAYQHGTDLDAREGMALCSVVAGLAFNNTRVGNCHAMATPLGALYHVPHGVSNAVCLVEVMRYNAEAVPHKYVRIAEALGEDVSGLSDREGALKAVERVAALRREIGLPETLRSVGARREDIPRLAEDAMKSGNVRVNPRDTQRRDMVRLYEAMYE